MGLKSYHFSLGNSNQGPVGMCAVIVAQSPEIAVRELRYRLEEIYMEDGGQMFRLMRENGEGEYINFYVNPSNITEKDIDEVT